MTTVLTRKVSRPQPDVEITETLHVRAVIADTDPYNSAPYRDATPADIIAFLPLLPEDTQREAREVLALDTYSAEKNRTVRVLRVERDALQSSLAAMIEAHQKTQAERDELHAILNADGTLSGADAHTDALDSARQGMADGDTLDELHELLWTKENRATTSELASVVRALKAARDEQARLFAALRSTLVTIADEACGLQPPDTSSEALLTMIERRMSEWRIEAGQMKRERDAAVERADALEGLRDAVGADRALRDKDLSKYDLCPTWDKSLVLVVHGRQASCRAETLAVWQAFDALPAASAEGKEATKGPGHCRLHGGYGFQSDCADCEPTPSGHPEREDRYRFATVDELRKDDLPLDSVGHVLELGHAMTCMCCGHDDIVRELEIGRGYGYTFEGSQWVRTPKWLIRLRGSIVAAREEGRREGWRDAMLYAGKHVSSWHGSPADGDAVRALPYQPAAVATGAK